MTDETTFALVDTLAPDRVLEIKSGRAIYRSHAAAVSAAHELLKKTQVPAGTKLCVRQCLVTAAGVRWV
jgi:hypothetical protein